MQSASQSSLGTHELSDETNSNPVFKDCTCGFAPCSASTAICFPSPHYLLVDIYPISFTRDQRDKGLRVMGKRKSGLVKQVCELHVQRQQLKLYLQIKNRRNDGEVYQETSLHSTY